MGVVIMLVYMVLVQGLVGSWEGLELMYSEGGTADSTLAGCMSFYCV